MSRQVPRQSRFHRAQSHAVAERIAEIREAIAGGRQDFVKGDVVSHEEALRRLAKW